MLATTYYAFSSAAFFPLPWFRTEFPPGLNKQQVLEMLCFVTG